MKARSLTQKSLLLITGLMAVAGCTPQKTAPTPAASPAAEIPAAQPAPASPPASRSAPTASPGKPSAPVRIELVRHVDTVSGVPADLVVLITPTSAVDRASGDISAAEGLQMTPVKFDLEALAAGTASRQPIQVTRSGAGSGFVRVVVETWQGDNRQTKVILLAVNGGEAVAPKPTAPVQTLPNGDRIISLPVEETTE